MTLHQSTSSGKERDTIFLHMTFKIENYRKCNKLSKNGTLLQKVQKQDNPISIPTHPQLLLKKTWLKNYTINRNVHIENPAKCSERR